MRSAIFCAVSRATIRAASTLSFDQPREVTRTGPPLPVASPASRVQYFASFTQTSIGDDATSGDAASHFVCFGGMLEVMHRAVIWIALVSLPATGAFAQR